MAKLSPLLIPVLLAPVRGSAALTPAQQAALMVFQFELGRGGSLAAMEAGDPYRKVDLMKDRVLVMLRTP